MPAREPVLETLMATPGGGGTIRSWRRPAGIGVRSPWVRGAATLWLLGMVAAGAWAQNASRGTAEAYVGRARVLIEYGRPWLRGRNVLDLIGPGQLWRLGSDAPTTIQSDAALDFGNVRVPKGKHILLVRYIRPGVWSLVFSRSPAIDYTPEARIAEVLMRFEQGQASVRQLTVRLDVQEGMVRVEIAWGAYRLSAGFAPVP